MKAASIPNLNRETTSFPNFFSLYQDVDHDDDMTLNERPNIDRDDNSEASETSPLNDILSLSPLVSSNEIGFLAASRSVMMFRCESEHTTSSVGSNQFSGNSRGARSEGTNPPQMDNYQQPQMSDSRILLQPLDQQRLFLDPSQSFSRSVAPQAQNMKELREIVPNGAKCSVDALLERTIKHMLFLQSVTKHADNLKQAGESKIINKDGGLLLKDNFEGGRKWAYEVGSQSMICPIIVEDLNRPRQMLVEMLCEERGLFLEIADIIRGLGLTILKGVMETWNDKIWARFAVEANRDVTRMEIFVSLVRLLEQNLLEQTTKNNAAASGNGIEFFHLGTSILATGQPCGLQ